MKKNINIFIIVILITLLSRPLKIFSQGAIDKSSGSGSTTEIDGEIGEWDPTDLNGPNFDGVDVEGNKPNIGDYYTISVTVPLNMEFMVLPNSSLVFGDFISPEYNIKNNGSKMISVKAKSIIQTPSAVGKDSARLYVEKAIAGDGKSQIELNLSRVENDFSNKKDVPLYRLNDIVNPLTESEKEIYTLSANEQKKVTFSAKYWELPHFEVNKDQAEGEFILGLEFSIANP